MPPRLRDGTTGFKSARRQPMQPPGGPAWVPSGELPAEAAAETAGEPDRRAQNRGFMSLVGSLEDLGLGDILQIVHLSGKSGALVVRSEHGEAQVLFHAGLIRAAEMKGGPTSLEELLAEHEAVPRDALGTAAQDARSRGCDLETVLVERSLSTADAIDQLRRDHIEAAVFEMFRWPTGDFSFEVKEIQGDGEGFFATPGVNPQFIALEGTRMADEAAFGGGSEELAFGTDGDGGMDGAHVVAESVLANEAPADEFAESVAVNESDLLGPDDAFPVADAITVGEPVADAEPIADVEAETVAISEPAFAETPTTSAAVSEAAATPAEAPVPAAAVAPAPRPPVIVVDTELAVLEWVKASLGDAFPQVHVFQRTDLAIARVRQYLARARVPMVVLSGNVPPDPVSGAEGPFELFRRLRRQASQMSVAVLAEPNEAVKAPTDAAPDVVVRKPTASSLADPRRVQDHVQMGLALQQDLIAAVRVDERPASAPVGVPPLERLRETSARLRDGGASGEVLPQVLEFASQSFDRVALFMVREDAATGIAQIGLARAGGPDEAALREIHLDVNDCARFRAVLEQRAPSRGPLTGEGDSQLAILLGNEIPPDAYVAPIQTADRVVALLYGDNLPGNTPIGDTAALEVLLDSAGIALERALLERELAAAEA